MQDKNKYKDLLLKQISKSIELFGMTDKEYSDERKLLDVLDVLESILAYSLCNISIDIPSIRDASEESYVNIKRKAILYYKNNMESVK